MGSLVRRWDAERQAAASSEGIRVVFSRLSPQLLAWLPCGRRGWELWECHPARCAYSTPGLQCVASFHPCCGPAEGGHGDGPTCRGCNRDPAITQGQAATRQWQSRRGPSTWPFVPRLDGPRGRGVRGRGGRWEPWPRCPTASSWRPHSRGQQHSLGARHTHLSLEQPFPTTPPCPSEPQSSLPLNGASNPLRVGGFWQWANETAHGRISDAPWGSAGPRTPPTQGLPMRKHFGSQVPLERDMPWEDYSPN